MPLVEASGDVEQALSGLGQELWAQVAVVSATICYAGGAIFGRGFKGIDPMMPAAGSLICGSIMLIPISLLIDRPWTLSPSQHSILALLALSAGALIYVGATHLLPRAEQEHKKFSLVALGGGVLVAVIIVASKQ